MAKAAVKIQSVYKGFQLRKKKGEKRRKAVDEDLPNLDDPDLSIIHL